MFFLFTIASNLYSQGFPGDLALQKLIEGNARFVSGKSTKPNQTIDTIRETSKGQAPFAVIVGCSDSRVPNEIIFDQGLGDLFIVRTAGQVSSFTSWGSIEFATLVLGAKLILVLGHTKCGAVVAACNGVKSPGHIGAIVNAIIPATQKAKLLPGDHVENSVRVNVAIEVLALRKLDPILSKLYKNEEIKIVGGVYDLDTGVVNYLTEKEIQAGK